MAMAPPSEPMNRGALCLAAMRIILGWMMIWAFLDKMFGLGYPSPPEVAMINGGSPTEYYLSELVSGPLSGIWNALAGNTIIDIALMLGLLGVGIGMMLGIASKLSTVGMVVMVLLMFTLNLPPEDNPLVNYHVFYAVAGLAIYWLGGFETYSLNGRWKDLPVVRDMPWLW